MFWGENKVISGISDAPLGRADVVISYHKKKNTDGVSSFFGNESVDLVSVESIPVIPEPMSSILFITGGVTLILRRYWKKKSLSLTS